MHRMAGALVAGLAMVVIGCGGSAALTETQLVARADTTCAQARTRSQKAVTVALKEFRAGRTTRERALADIAKTAARAQAAEMQTLSSLKPSGAVEDLYHRYVSQLRQRYVLEARLRASGNSNDGQLRALNHRRERIIDRLGFKQCS